MVCYRPEQENTGKHVKAAVAKGETEGGEQRVDVEVLRHWKTGAEGICRSAT